MDRFTGGKVSEARSGMKRTGKRGQFRRLNMLEKLRLGTEG